MGRYKLTVAIPTHNRPKQLAHTLSVIVPQVLEHDDVQLIILDNCSEIKARDVLYNVVQGKELPERIKVVRHSANIGGDANILRSFEVADGEWLWCSSDDDEPAIDAIDTILNDCGKEDHCYAYYGLEKDVPDVSDCANGYYIGTSIQEWARRIPSYGSRLFISESVFRIADMWPYMSLAYLVTSSGASQLVLAYCAVVNGGKYLLSAKQISRYKQPEGGFGYNFSRLACGSALLCMLQTKGHIDDFKVFFVKSYQNWISPKLYLSHALVMYKSLPAHEFYKHFSLISAVMKPPFLDSPLQWCKWSVCQVMSIAPCLAKKIL